MTITALLDRPVDAGGDYFVVVAHRARPLDADGDVTQARGAVGAVEAVPRRWRALDHGLVRPHLAADDATGRVLGALAVPDPALARRHQLPAARTVSACDPRARRRPRRSGGRRGWPAPVVTGVTDAGVTM